MVILCSLPVPRSGRDIDYAVGVDVKRHLDLRHSAGRRRMPCSEPSERPVVARGRARPGAGFPLSLAVFSGGEVWLLRVGMVVFLSINFVDTPPRVSMPSDRASRRAPRP